MRPCRHEFHVVSHVNRVHFSASMSSCRHEFHVGSPCKGPLTRQFIAVQDNPGQYRTGQAGFAHINMVFLHKNPCLEKFTSLTWLKDYFHNGEDSCYVKKHNACIASVIRI